MFYLYFFIRSLRKSKNRKGMWIPDGGDSVGWDLAIPLEEVGVGYA